MANQPPMDYKTAGVDIDAGNELVERIKPFCRETHHPQVLTGLGGFAGLYDISQHTMQHPVLVSCTDGVGTKLKLAQELNCHEHIGIDLVAMCVNDLAVMGATPLFFLDYYATGKLDVDTAATVIRSIAHGCKQANTALIGGESAEMPGVYQTGDYDLAGFVVGMVDKNQIIDGSTVSPGDALIAVSASGLHSNGYSLARKIVADCELDLNQSFAHHTLGEALLTPTHIYSQLCLDLIQAMPIKAAAHITGGGITENLPRVLPKTCGAVIHRDSWQLPALFSLLQQQGHINDMEMLKTFNCGVGLILAVAPEHIEHCITISENAGYNSWQIGMVAPSTSLTCSIEYQ